MDLPAGPQPDSFNTGSTWARCEGLAAPGSLGICLVCHGNQAQEVFVISMELFSVELRFLSLPVHGISSILPASFTPKRALQGIPGGQ